MKYVGCSASPSPSLLHASNLWLYKVLNLGIFMEMASLGILTGRVYLLKSNTCKLGNTLFYLCFLNALCTCIRFSWKWNCTPNDLMLLIVWLPKLYAHSCNPRGRKKPVAVLMRASGELHTYHCVCATHSQLGSEISVITTSVASSHQIWNQLLISTQWYYLTTTFLEA